ncbi:MAG: EAL domain-containing protein [Kineosporiaceae bacterium]
MDVNDPDQHVTIDLDARQRRATRVTPAPRRRTAGGDPLMDLMMDGDRADHDDEATEADEDPGMHDTGRTGPTSTEVGKALRRHEIGVVFQRCIDLRTDESVGEEVFVRWRHPDLGELRPGRFLDACTPSMTAKVDRRVVHETLRGVRHRISHREQVPEVWLNLALPSLRRMRTRWHLGRMARALDADLTSLVLEIPHGDLLAARPRDLRHLRTLGRHGAVIHVDQAMVDRLDELDLHSLTVRAIKVDATQIDARVGAAPGVPGEDLPHWARERDLVVIVARLETAEQRDAAQAMGLWLAQGHLIAEPVPA